MKPIKVMVNGIPGNMASRTAELLMEDSDLQVIPFALTGPEITESKYNVGDVEFQLIHPDDRDLRLAELIAEEQFFITVDYTHPSAVNSNVDFYCRNHLPFVMGTTGGDREFMEKTVLNSTISAVIAPNMAKQIVGFQAMMEYGARNFPDLFEGYTLEISESHQEAKADTSGTAKAMVSYFNRMGIDFSVDQIQKIRNPEVQKTHWNIPSQYIDGHGWHTYTLTSADRTVRFIFRHNVNGRDVYAKGTIDAIRFLSAKLEEKASGKVYSMIDVLKGT